MFDRILYVMCSYVLCSEYRLIDSIQCASVCMCFFVHILLLSLSASVTFLHTSSCQAIVEQLLLRQCTFQLINNRHFFSMGLSQSVYVKTDDH